jgi:ribose transport system ATP-binding protein
VKQKILEMKGVHKSFPGIKALNDVDFSLFRGEVRAIVGKNGAGKSTLIKILTGIYSIDQGELILEGNPVQNITVEKMNKLGIEAIYQENDFVPYFTIGETLLLNNEPTIKNNGLFLDKKRLHKTAAEKLKTHLGFVIDPYRLVSELNVSERQLVQIGRSIIKEPKILIFDEPTAPLSETEIDNLFNIIRSLRDKGVTIIYISHRLEEIFEICDSVTIMRDSKKIVDLDLTKGTVNEDDIITHMIGTKQEDKKKRSASFDYSSSKPLLIADNLNSDLFNNISFNIHPGEIVGIYGAEGAGQQDIGRSLFGLVPIHSGELTLQGKTLSIKDPQIAVKNGIGYIPRDRRQEGLVIDFTIQENISLVNLAKYAKSGLIKRKVEINVAETAITNLSIATSGIKKVVRYLSGGNQQKVVIAKWLTLDLHILILDYPTMGIDVQAKEEVYKIIQMIAAKDTAVLLITPEYQELESLCDKVLVVKNGNLVAEVPVSTLSEDKLLKYAIGSAGSNETSADEGGLL